MKKQTSKLVWTAIAFSTTLSAVTAAPAWAQVAGSTKTDEVSITESTRVALGWSVKKTLLGKSIYNDVGQKIGKVDDLIISPDRNVSYVIVAAGGFIGIGRHDVAIPVSQIQDKSGKLIIPGVTKDSIAALPEFTYATEASRREQFLAAADQDIAQGKAAVTSLEKKASAATADVKAKIDIDITSLQLDVKSAEAKVAELKQASAARWKEFEVSVSAATARLRKSTEKALS